MTIDAVEVRPAVMSDRERILEISSQIWDGDDYIPHVLDAWMSGGRGQLVVAAIGGHVVSFAHRTWLTPQIAWFEGIRTDPAFEGHGAAKAITRALIADVSALGAERINLSTYIDNKASIRILEAHGFRRMATFSYLEREPVPPAVECEPGSCVRDLSVDEMITYMQDAEFLSRSGGRVAHGWSFFPFEGDPERAVGAFFCRLGSMAEGRLTAVLGGFRHTERDETISLGFLDGEPSGIRCLVHRILELHPDRRMECMVPVVPDTEAYLLDVLREAGFTSWNQDVPDVYVYELLLEKPRDRADSQG